MEGSIALGLAKPNPGTRQSLRAARHSKTPNLAKNRPRLAGLRFCLVRESFPLSILLGINPAVTMNVHASWRRLARALVVVVPVTHLFALLTSLAPAPVRAADP